LGRQIFRAIELAYFLSFQLIEAIPASSSISPSSIRSRSSTALPYRLGPCSTAVLRPAGYDFDRCNLGSIAQAKADQVRSKVALRFVGA
jgi:hypothetical protein